jgi:NAD(P)-dependent dehydrogenase (short-subunit alcohol dehydrogenase family)
VIAERQKTLLLVWELGENLGHIAALRGVAQRLRRQGWRCVFVLRNLHSAQTMCVDADGQVFEFVQAPVNWFKAGAVAAPVNHADVLLKFAFGEPSALEALVSAWKALLLQWKPAIVLLETAPTAQLACNALGIPTVVTGTGFSIPPDTPNEPWPAFPQRKLVDRSRLLEAERSLLHNILQVAAACGYAPLERVQDLYSNTRALIGSLPELDHYPRGAKATYVGPPELSSSGPAPVWPVRMGPADKGAVPPKVFLYLRAEYPALAQVMAVLQGAQIQVAGYVAGFSLADLKRWSTDKVFLSSEPMDSAQAMAQCDVVVCHGGTLAQLACLHAKPVCLLPTQTEQRMTAARITALGLGVACELEQISDLKRLVKQVTTTESFRVQVQAFSHRNQHYLNETATQKICEAILNR